MKRKLKVVLVVGILVVTGLLLYWWMFAPFVSRLFISRDCIHQGLKYYKDNVYLDFENGGDFQRFLLRFGISEETCAEDFYYVDNWVEDNPIYGKMCDIYALDVKYTAEEYTSIKREISAIAENYEFIGDFISYALPYDSALQDLIFVISFCDKTETIRFSMITEFDTTDDFGRVFRRHANLEWDIEA